MSLSEYQFHFVQPGYVPKKRGATGSASEARQRKEEDPGKVIATHTETGDVAGAMSFSHKEWPKGGMGRGVDTLVVDPAHRGQGLSDAMYHLASHEMGYAVGHSRDLTTAGAKFANRVGGPSGQSGEMNRRTHSDIEIPAGSLNNRVMRDDLKTARPIDQSISNSLQRAPKPKRRKAAKQDTLPGADWSQY